MVPIQCTILLAKGTMGKLIRWILQFIGLPSDLETIGNLLLAWFGVSAMTGAWAWFQQGFHWGLFIASGMFAFGAYAFGRLSELKEKTRLEYKLRIPKMDATVLGNKANKSIGMRLRFVISNTADFPIFCEIEECFQSISEKTRQPNTKFKTMLPPIEMSSFVLPEITFSESEWRDGLTGWVKIVMIYGKQQEENKMRMRCEFAFDGSIVSASAPEAEDTLLFAYRLIDLKYEKVGV